MLGMYILAASMDPLATFSRDRRLLLMLFQTEESPAPAPMWAELAASVVAGASAALTVGVGVWSGVIVGI